MNSNDSFRRRLAMLALVLAAKSSAGDPVFNVRDFGATGGGAVMDTVAIQKAIDSAANAGGGAVVLPQGIYLSGSLDLKSHVTLQLDAGATLLGSPHRADYHKVNFHGLVLADKQEDIAICGQGTIVGQGAALSSDTERRWQQGALPDAKEGQRPVLINFRDCANVTVRDVTLKDSACWVQDYRDCKHLTIDHVTVRSCAAYNNDGIDIDGCSQVVVRGCDIDSEDDAICLKSGDRTCEDVLVENCRLRSSCNGLKFGTASVAGFNRVVCRNLFIYDTYISAIALEMVDGGEMQHIRVSDITITNCSNPLFMRLGHRNVHGEAGSFHDVVISNVVAEIPNRPASDFNKFPDSTGHNGRRTLMTAAILGLPGHPIRDVTLQNISLVYGGMGSDAQPGQPGLDSLAKVPERAATYPEISPFGVLPAWGFYCRHAEGIHFTNVTLRVQGLDYRPALLCDDTRNIALDDFHVLSAGSEPVIVLNDAQGVVMRNTTAPPGAARFIQSLGNTRDVMGP